jgi:hypothetical protein
MYFEEFNKIPYDFPAKIDGSNEFIFVKDITKNVRFRKDFLQSLLLYEDYRITDGETPEIISEKLYGTPYYHWILMLANSKFDYIQDFPLSVNKLDIMVESKYGDRKHDISYFTDTQRNRIQGNQFITAENVYLDEEGQFLIDKIKVGTVVRKETKNGIYNGFVKALDREKLTLDVLLSTSGFKSGETVQTYNYVEDEDGAIIEQYLGEFLIQDLQYPLNVLSVTNYEYEIFENEKKRTLKVIPKIYLDQIISEYSDMMQI